MELNRRLEKIASGYHIEQKRAFAKNSFADFVRESRDDLQAVVGPRFLADASPGKGNWAEVPWLGVFDPAITKSAQSGFYVVYLFVPGAQALYLSLNQGTTEMYEEFGREYLAKLEERGAYFRALLSDSIRDRELSLGPIDLRARGQMPRGYEAGNVVARFYRLEDLSNNLDVLDDLTFFLKLYKLLIERYYNTEPQESEPEDQRGYVGQEGRRRMRWHKSSERNSKLATEAKKVLGFDCQACGFNFEKFYGTRGRGYIEAHHIVPYSELAEMPEPILLDASKDFAVVCANCHRMIHRDKNQLTISQIQELVNTQNRGSK